MTSREAAIEKLRWYALRWKLEVFHKIVKSGCRVEAARLRTAERPVRLIAVFCVLSWRAFWLTMINRAAPCASPRLAITGEEIALLDRLMPDKGQPPPGARTLRFYMAKIARLGGYLARARDPPPGNMSCGAVSRSSRTSRWAHSPHASGRDVGNRKGHRGLASFIARCVSMTAAVRPTLPSPEAADLLRAVIA